MFRSFGRVWKFKCFRSTAPRLKKLAPLGMALILITAGTANAGTGFVKRDLVIHHFQPNTLPTYGLRSLGRDGGIFEVFTLNQSHGDSA